LGLDVCGPAGAEAAGPAASGRAVCDAGAAAAKFDAASAAAAVEAPQAQAAPCIAAAASADLAKKGKGGAASAAQASPSKLKVLALHGHAQSASRFKGKIAAVTKEVKSLAEFEFIDGPFPVDECEHSEENGLGAAFTWIDTSKAGELGGGRCTKYAGVETVFDEILGRQFDGVIAFSMGACVLASLLCHPEHGPTLRSRIRFAAFFSGFIPKDPLLRSWIEECSASGPLTGLPTFHSMGLSDEIIVPARSEELAEKFENAVLYRHEGGHVVPAAMRKDFKAFLAKV